MGCCAVGGRECPTHRAGCASNAEVVRRGDVCGHRVLYTPQSRRGTFLFTLPIKSHKMQHVHFAQIVPLFFSRAGKNSHLRTERRSRAVACPRPPAPGRDAVRTKRPANSCSQCARSPSTHVSQASQVGLRSDQVNGAHIKQTLEGSRAPLAR